MGCLMLSGGRESRPYPRGDAEAEPRDGNRPELFSGARLIDPLDEGRDGIGVNFCHPAPLLLPRDGVTTRSLPGLGVECHVELPVPRPAGPEGRSLKVRG
jgi:hypothetical protein